MEIFSALPALCKENSPVTGEFPRKGLWRGALMFSLICAWTSSWANNGDACDLRRHRGHYDLTILFRMYFSWARFQSMAEQCLNTRGRHFCKFYPHCLSSWSPIDSKWTQGAVSIRKTVLPGMAIPMLKIRRPNGRLIFNMEIAIRR